MAMNTIEKFFRSDLGSIGLNIANVKNLKFQLFSTLSEEMEKVKRNLLIDYGEFGSHLPAVDFVIYKRQTGKVIVVILDKIDDYKNALEAAYINTRYSLAPYTKHIKVLYTVSDRKRIKSAKTIIDIDGDYNLIGSSIDISDKIKTFAKLIKYLKNISD
jgi:type II restriction enzyme